MTKLNADALGKSCAITGAFAMLVLGIVGNLGFYQGAVQMMQQWHAFFDLSVGGIIAGMVEAAIISYIFIYIFGWAYNNTN